MQEGQNALRQLEINLGLKQGQFSANCAFAVYQICVYMHAERCTFVTF